MKHGFFSGSCHDLGCILGGDIASQHIFLEGIFYSQLFGAALGFQVLDCFFNLRDIFVTLLVRLPPFGRCFGGLMTLKKFIITGKQEVIGQPSRQDFPSVSKEQRASRIRTRWTEVARFSAMGGCLGPFFFSFYEKKRMAGQKSGWVDGLDGLFFKKMMSH